METIPDETDAPNLVTNQEVLQLLSEQLSSREEHRTGGRRKDNPRVRQRDWIENQVHRYLAQVTPPSDPDLAPLVHLLRQDYKLTDAEILQIVNFLPSESVETHMIIDDLPSRLPADQEKSLLKLIARFRKCEPAEKAETPGSGAEDEVGPDRDIEMNDSKSATAENGESNHISLKEKQPS